MQKRHDWQGKMLKTVSEWKKCQNKYCKEIT